MKQEKKNLDLDNKISILSQTNNYYSISYVDDNELIKKGKAIRILSTITDEEAQILFNIPTIQNAIFNIKNTEILRIIFEKAPSFFQEKMFNNEEIQDYLLAPKPGLKRQELFEIYKGKDITFNAKELKKLENFLHSIKSPLICEQVIESKYFQRIIALCSVIQLNISIFNNINIVKLFDNIINDDAIFKTKIARKRNILAIFNKVSNHILLSKDHEKLVNPISFLYYKRKNFLYEEEVIINKKTLSLMSLEMINELLSFENIDKNIILDFLNNDIFKYLTINNYNFYQIFSHLLTSKYPWFTDIDYMCFNIIIDECENNETLKENFINFIYTVLGNNQIFDEEKNKMLKDTLYNKMKTHTISKDDYQKLFFQPDISKTLFYLNFSNSKINAYDTFKEEFESKYLNKQKIKEISLN